ncbi:MAG: hypothetical protein GC185_00160 [Alphaproteobacteria bacterium]|nr:hypothetical protein [Alphaproteobacteria bacterium]
MNPEDIKRKQNTVVRHAKAFEATYRSLESLQKLVEIYGGDEVIASALFSSVIIHYGRAFKANKKDGKTETYPIKLLKPYEGFDEAIHRDLLLVRDKFVAHQDWDAEGRGWGRGILSGDVNGKPYKVIHEQSVVITSLTNVSKEHLFVWNRHIKSTYAALRDLTMKELKILLDLGVKYPDLFEVKEELTHLQFPAIEFSANSEFKMPSVRSLALAEPLTKKSRDIIGDKYIYRHITFSHHLDTVVINEGEKDEIRFDLKHNLKALNQV